MSLKETAREILRLCHYSKFLTCFSVLCFQVEGDSRCICQTQGSTENTSRIGTPSKILQSGLGKSSLGIQSCFAGCDDFVWIWIHSTHPYQPSFWSSLRLLLSCGHHPLHWTFPVCLQGHGET